MIDEEGGDRLQLRDERPVTSRSYFRRPRWLLMVGGVLLFGGILIHLFSRSLMRTTPFVSKLETADVADEGKLLPDAPLESSPAVYHVPEGSAGREAWLETLKSKFNKTNAPVHWTGAPIHVNESWPSQLILHSPLPADTETLVLNRQLFETAHTGNDTAKKVRPSAMLWDWEDSCAFEKQKAGSSDLRELQLRALGPAAGLVKSMLPSQRPCVGTAYLRFFQSSMTFKHRNTLQFSDHSRLHWLVDTDFASFSNLTVPPYFTYISEPDEVCAQSSEVTVFILSYCHPKDKEVRRIIRDYLPVPDDVRRVFVVGRPMKKTGYVTRCDWQTCEEDHSYDNALLDEQRKYQDLVWVNFTETYQNLTMKTASAFQWARTRCPQAKVVYKMDKDLYANYGRLTEYLKEKLANNYRYTWLGTCMTYSPLRSKARNTVTWDEWPSNYYPNYASGVGYAYARSMLPHQLLGMYRIPIPPIEDMYMGTVNTALGFVCEYGPSWGLPPADDKFALCNKVLTTWEVSSNDLTVAYKDGKLDRSIMPKILQQWPACAVNKKKVSEG